MQCIEQLFLIKNFTDITVNNADCIHLTAIDKKTLSGLIDCVETALVR